MDEGAAVRPDVRIDIEAHFGVFADAVLRASSRLEWAREALRRALGPRANGVRFVDGMALPEPVRTCSGAKRRRNARRSRR